MTLVVANLQPKSSGFVKLSRIDGRPSIKTNFLSNPADLEMMVKGMKIQIDFENTKSYREHGGQFIHIPIDECDRDFAFRSDDYYRCYIKYFSLSGCHNVGTSKMGPSSDPMAVVDQRSKVRSVANLRQIDAGM